MPRALTSIALALLLLCSLPTAHAQEADMAWFESFDGLDRVIARSWMAPMTVSESTRSETVEINDAGTPVVISTTESTPSATPEPQSGIGMLSIFVYFFDSDENAATGFDRIDADLQETTERDPRAPMTDPLPLDGVANQARGYMGDLTSDGQNITYTFATVQDGPFVYSITGKFSGVDAAALTNDIAESLTAAPMNRMAEHYHQDGASRGGLWHKLNAVEPDMPPGSTAMDLIIYPMESATPEGSLLDAPTIDLQNPASIDGLTSIHGVTYGPGTGSATPETGDSGTFHIESWILTFDTTDQAERTSTVLANTLADPLGITSASTEFTQQDGAFTSTTILEGFINDLTLPIGNGVVHVTQVNETVYAVVVLTEDPDPLPVASDISQQLIDTPASNPDERFPVAGDPVLERLTPLESHNPAATPAP